MKKGLATALHGFFTPKPLQKQWFLGLFLVHLRQPCCCFSGKRG
jgi:hypothetical protein